MIPALGREFGKMGMNLPADPTQIGGALGEGGKQCDAFFLSHGDVGAGAALAVHQPFIFQVAHSTSDGGARCGKGLGQLGLGGEAVSRLKQTRRDIA